MRGLFSVEGRKRLAKLLVWGSPPGEYHYTRSEIEERILVTLTRIADRLERLEAMDDGILQRAPQIESLSKLRRAGERQERRQSPRS